MLERFRELFMLALKLPRNQDNYEYLISEWDSECENFREVMDNQREEDTREVSMEMLMYKKFVEEFSKNQSDLIEFIWGDKDYALIDSGSLTDINKELCNRVKNMIKKNK